MIDFTQNPIIPADYKSRGRGLPYEASPLEPVLLLVRCFFAVAFAVSLQAAGCFEFFDSVGFFPGEVGVFAAEVTVGCRLFVDGATQV